MRNKKLQWRYHCNNLILIIYNLLQQDFLLYKPITSNFIATPYINYCNNFNVIATIIFVVMNIFSCWNGLNLVTFIMFLC